MKRLIGAIVLLAAVLTAQSSLTPKAQAGWGGFSGPGGIVGWDEQPILLLNPSGPPLGCSSSSSLPAGTVACVISVPPIGGSGGEIQVPCEASMVDNSVATMTCTVGPSVVQSPPTGGASVVQSAPSAAPSANSREPTYTKTAIVDTRLSLGCDRTGCDETCDGPLPSDTPTDQLASQLCGIVPAFQQLPRGQSSVSPAAQDVCNKLADMGNLVNAQVQQGALSSDGAALLMNQLQYWFTAGRLGGCVPPPDWG